MIEALKSASALFVGLALIMLGNGLQGSLVAIRAQMEGFGLSVTGTVMAGYFVGFFAGSFLVPRLVASVGHVRVFGALASLASLSVLIYPLFVDPSLWFAMRVATGFCYAGLYIICESWLNDKATNETRGQMMSIYMVISLFGMAGGQYLLNLFDPGDFQLFTVVSVLVSLAVVPVLVSAAKAPDFSAPETISPARLYRISPLGVVAMVIVGMTAGVLLSMGPAYVLLQDLDVADASIFMSALFIGGFLLTWPIGRLSDLMDRRTVILVVASLASVACVFSMTLTGDQKLLIFIMAGLAGGFIFPLYSLVIAHTNDHLNPSQMVAASATLIMANGAGAMLGPNLAGFVMEWIGAPGFFATMAGTQGAIALFTVWRMTRRAAVASEDQGTFVGMAPRMTPVAITLSPEAEWPPEWQNDDGDDHDTGEPFDDGDDAAVSEER